MHTYSDNRISTLTYLFAYDIVIQTVFIAENDVFLRCSCRFLFRLGLRFFLLFGGPELLTLVRHCLGVFTALGRKCAHVGLGFV